MKEFEEVELKYLLGSDADLEMLAQSLSGFQADLKQQNIYLDVSGKLRTRGCLCRIRIENGKGEVTLKVAGGIKDGVSSATEFSEPLTSVALKQVELNDFMGALRGMKCLEKLESLCGEELAYLKEWGRIRNRRRCFRLDQGWVVELDRALFPDGTIRRELEVETDDPRGTREVIDGILGNLQISWQEAHESKSCQLFRILDESGAES
ncbi:MAG: CYTH domain-containing protein [Planctomycetes bacterium]|nr:CYTH domain-containing protein [Planctomycetota bacterium]